MIFNYNYHNECKKLLNDLANITQDIAFIRLDNIQKKTLEAYPFAEPDGDIAYCLADTVDKILEFYDNELTNQK